MVDEIHYKEWGISEELPGAFVNWMNKYVCEELEEDIAIQTIASDLGVKAAYLSRWLAGLGPLTESNIKSLVKIFGPFIYTLLWIQRPNNL
jgi:hypothetical protein